MFFRKRPVIIDAVRWMHDDDEWQGYVGNDNAARFLGEHYVSISGDSGDSLLIQTLEGTLTALRGDWLICGVKGEHYACKPDIFELTYEPVKRGGILE